MKVALIQLNSTDNQQQNLTTVTDLIDAACQESKLDLVALPEMFPFVGGSKAAKQNVAEEITLSESVSLLQALAKKYTVFIHGGSFCEKEGEHYFNTSPVISPEGKIIAIYRKIHLFNFSGEQAEYSESSLLSSGTDLVTYQVNDIRIGCAICFDLRFGHLFESYRNKGVRMIIIPSAFTYETGKAHWEILLRARAIETQCFILAPAQTGCYLQDGQQRVSWGHSLIVDPWGNILASMEQQPGYIISELNFAFLDQVRKRLPIHCHCRKYPW